GKLLPRSLHDALPISTSVHTTSAFWERLWRMSGIQFAVFFIITYVIYGYQPQVGAPTDALVAFYDGHRVRVLTAAFFSGLNLLRSEEHTTELQSPYEL